MAKKNATTLNKTSDSTRTRFWMVLTSNYLLFLFLVGLIIAPIFDKDLGFKDLLLVLMFYIILIVPIILVSTYIAYAITLFSKSTPIYNYALNLFIHTVSVVLFIKWWKKV